MRTGTAAQAAKDMVNGLTLYLDEIGHQMAGRKVELIVEDSQSRPDVALTSSASCDASLSLVAGGPAPAG
jgi:ABC-type branched-subunit amino acid transport system substrate-binding protein